MHRSQLPFSRPRLWHRSRNCVAAVLAATLLATAASGTGEAHAVTAPIATATQAATVLDMNTQLGSVRLPIQCAFPILGTQTLVAEFQGTFTTLLSSRQQFYLDDGKGALEIPAHLVGLLRGLGATKFNATVDTFNVVSNNASPSQINALGNSPVKLTGVALPTSGGATIPVIPAGGGAKVGPFTAGSSGRVELGLGTTGGSLTIADGIGSVLGKLSVSCAAPNPRVILAGINIDPNGTDTSVSRPTDHGLYTYPVAPLQHQLGSGKVPLVCQFPGIGQRTVALTFTGDAGTSYGSTEKFYLANASGALQIPGGLVDEIRAKTGASAVQATITKFDIDGSGTTPTSINAAASPFVLPTQAVSAGQELTLTIPAKGLLNVGPFTSTGPGVMALEVGDSAATVNLLKADGNSAGSMSVTCAKRSPAVIIVPLVSVTATSGTPSGGFAWFANGSSAGGQIVTLSGSNLSQLQEVWFGDQPAPWLSSLGNNIALVQTPAHMVGKVSVRLRGLGGTGSGGWFTFTK